MLWVNWSGKLLAAASFGAAMAMSLPAQAINTRTWISGKGVDQSGCGAIASPCRTLQFAHDQTIAGGEIDVLDGAGYGAVIITKPINIVNDGGGIAGVLAAPGGNAITINAPPGAIDAKILLRGLTIEGAGKGAVGILYNSGGFLTVSNCVVQGFTGTNDLAGHGIAIRHTQNFSAITIEDTLVTDNDRVGVYYIPTGSVGGRLWTRNLRLVANGYGFAADIRGVTNGVQGVTLTNTSAVHNLNDGFQFNGNNQLSAALYDSFAQSNSSADLRVTNTPLLLSGNKINTYVADASNVCSAGNNVIGTAVTFPCSKALR